MAKSWLTDWSYWSNKSKRIYDWGYKRSRDEKQLESLLASDQIDDKSYPSDESEDEIPFTDVLIHENQEPLHSEVERQTFSTNSYRRLWSKLMLDPLLKYYENQFDYAPYLGEHPPFTKKEGKKELKKFGLIARVPDIPKVHRIPSRKEFTIKGKNLQVIVKVSQIVLTPENPVFEGEELHVDGMANEAIVASGVYCFHSENISECFVTFHQSSQAPGFFPYHHEYICDEEDLDLFTGPIYNLFDGSEMNSSLGAIKIESNNCFAYPNIFSHQIESFNDLQRLKQNRFLEQKSAFFGSLLRFPKQMDFE